MADAVGGVETRRVLRPDGTLIVHTTTPNGRLALEMLARMSSEWRPVKAAPPEVSPPGRRRAGGMLDDGPQHLADKVRAAPEN